jgi:hypothetical protein
MRGFGLSGRSCRAWAWPTEALDPLAEAKVAAEIDDPASYQFQDHP